MIILISRGFLFNLRNVSPPPFLSLSLSADMTDEKVQEIIDKAMISGSLKQRDMVGVITGLMGSGKTKTL